MNIHDLDNSNKRRLSWLKTNGYYDFIMSQTNHLPEQASIQERIYLLQSGLRNQPDCPVCGSPTRFSQTKRRYTEFCSKACANQSRVKFNLEDCIRRYEAGESLISIAKSYQISDVSLKKRLEVIGVVIRTHGENQRLQYTKNKNHMHPHIDFDKLNDVDWIIEQNKTRSIQDIASEIGVAAPVIFKRLPVGYTSTIH